MASSAPAQADDEFSFQDFPSGSYDEDGDLTSTERDVLVQEEDDSDQPRPPSSGGPSFYQLEYYQSFFNVDTNEVKRRIVASMIPFRSSFFDMIQNKSDLYGPFWISTTLIFVLAMAGNMANYHATTADKKVSWHYDFSKVTLAATTIYSFIILVPFILWAVLRYRSNVVPPLLEILCIYGYSFFIFIPVAILCAIPGMGTLSITLTVTLAALVSLSVILSSFGKSLKSVAKNITFQVSVIVVACHTGLVGAFVLYFFRY